MSHSVEYNKLKKYLENIIVGDYVGSPKKVSRRCTQLANSIEECYDTQVISEKENSILRFMLRQARSTVGLDNVSTSLVLEDLEDENELTHEMGGY